MPKTTPERRAEIKARCDAATLGPWYIGSDGWSVWNSQALNTFVCDGTYREEAEFIAAARQDVPDLLADLEEAENTITDLSNQLAKRMISRGDVCADRDRWRTRFEELCDAYLEVCGEECRSPCIFFVDSKTCVCRLKDGDLA